jgi:hypothetical protein
MYTILISVQNRLLSYISSYCIFIWSKNIQIHLTKKIVGDCMLLHCFWRDFIKQRPTWLLLLVILVIWMNFQELIGKYLVRVLGILVLILGLPHGALDWFIAIKFHLIYDVQSAIIFSL